MASLHFFGRMSHMPPSPNRNMPISPKLQPEQKANMYSFPTEQSSLYHPLRFFQASPVIILGTICKGTLTLVGGSKSGSGHLGVLLPKKTLSGFCHCHFLFHISLFSFAYFPMKKLEAVKIPDQGECCGLSGGSVHSPEAGLKAIFTPSIGLSFRTSHHTMKMQNL